MSKTTKILVAATMLVGGVKNKAGGIDAAELNAGDELTKDKAKALGLSGEDVAALIAQGKLEEVDARLAEAAPQADGGAALAEAVARAEKAEAEIAELKKQLDAAKKPVQ